VRKTVEEYPFSVKVAHPFEQVTVSLGVSTVSQGGGKTIPEIMNEADIALYRSKATGKNRVTSYGESCAMPGPAPDPRQGYQP
jgi:diguanylate cyclase (GGDEF)-like protein